MKTLLQTLAALALTAVFLGAMLAIAEQPRARFHGEDDERYNAIYGQEGAVSLATGGTSRARRAFYAPYLSRDLAAFADDGRTPVVYDLGVAGAGIDSQVTVLLALLEQRKVDTLVFQFYHAGRARMHGRYHRLATLADLWQAPLSRFSLFDRFQMRANASYLRIGDMLDFCPLPGAGCLGAAEKMPATSVDDTWPREMRIEALEDRLQLAEEAGEVFFVPREEMTADVFLNRRSMYYLRRLFRLAAEKGTHVVMVELPKTGWGPLDETVFAEAEAQLGTRILHFTPDEMRAMSFTAFGDLGHVNLIGERLVRARLVDYLRGRDLGEAGGN